MLVRTAMKGERQRKDRSLSSASATMESQAPSLALAPIVFRRPPAMRVRAKAPPSRGGGGAGAGGRARGRPAGGAVLLNVRPRNFVTEVEEALGDAVHARPADADHMD